MPRYTILRITPGEGLTADEYLAFAKVTPTLAMVQRQILQGNFIHRADCDFYSLFAVWRILQPCDAVVQYELIDNDYKIVRIHSSRALDYLTLREPITIPFVETCDGKCLLSGESYREIVRQQQRRALALRDTSREINKLSCLLFSISRQ